MRLRLWQMVLGGVASAGIALAACGGDNGGAGATDGASSSDGPANDSRGSSSGAGGRDGGSGATGDATADVRADTLADQRSADQGASDGSTVDGSGADGSGTGGDGGSGTDAGVDAALPGPSVLEHHNSATRDGFYIDPALKKSAIQTMHLDTVFSASTTSTTFSQPLLMAGGVNGQDALYVATENNDVYAFSPTTGMQLWTVNLGSPASGGSPCPGSITPIGVAGTPVIDPVGRAIYLNAATGGGSLKHMIYSLSVDTGKTNWSLDVSTISGFDSAVQNQRGALALVGGKLFVPYGGFDGDCGNYKGWVVAVPVNSPTSATGWQTAALSGPGIWAPAGIASDGTSLFVPTGNTNANQRPSVWTMANSEAIIKLSTAPAFSGNSADYFAPTDWLNLDVGDADFGSSGVVLFDAPNATPSHLAFAIGKTSTGRLVDRTNLGGIGSGVSNIASNGQVFGSLFAYNTAQGTYVGAQTSFSGCMGDFGVLKVSNSAQLSVAWCASSGGSGGPISSNTSPNGADAIVWSFGAAGDRTLRAWDADTGMSLPLSSSVTVSGSVEQWTSPIIANGRIYVAGDGAVYAFGL